MNYLDETLAAFADPCAIYEWPALEFVAINEPGEKWRQRVLDPRVPSQARLAWIGVPAEELRARIEKDPEGHLRLDTPAGILHATLMPPLVDRLPRPTLLLCSAHPGDDAREARATHIRMRIALMVYELEEVTTKLLVNAEEQIGVARETIQAVKGNLVTQMVKINQKNLD